MKTITVRLADDAYESVKQHACADQVSMNAWIETALDREDLRRRCTAHEQWLRNNPDMAALAEQRADQHADNLANR